MSPCDNCSHRRVCVFEDHPNYRKENCSNYEKIRPHGKWEGEQKSKMLITRKCTACCGRSAVGNFCMWCGADMLKKEGEQE